jgi:hypothetical protein
MGFTIPNYTDAVTNKEVGDQAEPDSVDFQILGNPSNGVVYDPTNFANNARVRSEETISNSVRIDPYKVFINGVYYANTSASITLSLGEGTANPRFDLVVIRASSPTASSAVVIAGTTSATNPEFPAITENDVVIAAVYRSGVGVSGYIDSSHIVDKRLFLNSNQTWVKAFSPITNTDGSATSAKIGDLWLDTSATANGQTMLWVKQASGSWKNISSYIEATNSAIANTLVLRDGSGNFNATNASNATTVANLAVHGGRNNESNKVVRTDGNGYLQTGYINAGGAPYDEYNASSPDRVWGSNGGGDAYLRTYRTSSLSVASAAYAENANNLDGYSSSITGEPNTIALVDGIGILSAKYFGMGVSNATFWVATTYSGDTIFRAVGNTGVYGQAVGTSGTRAVYVNSSGTLGVASTSSRKYKENIVPYIDLTNKLLNVSPVIFDYKTGVLESDHDNDRFNQFGLIAEEVHDAGLTHLVSYDKQGKPDGISYERISLELLSVVKNLNEKIKVLEARVDELEDK